MILIVFLPLISFLIISLVGRWLGRWSCLFLSVISQILSFFLSFYYFLDVLNGKIIVCKLFNWISVGYFTVDFEIIFDPLSSIFSLLISFISSLVLTYSLSYMREDPNQVTFFSYLNFFAFSMLLLVLSNNFLQLFFGWEAVGLASYLLINFWHTRNLANTGALKAIIFNRVGDVFLLAAIALVFILFKSLNFGVVFLLVPQILGKDWFGINCLELLAMFLLLAAMAKSAQILLHPWLPDAMEGPTPVSSLLHSATMVTAGIFLIMRSSVIFSYAPSVSYFVAVIGLITALFSSFTGLLQFDIKRIIAFSTCSQLGFMMFATGLGNYNFALFHLVNHAFFKALLFLSAGSVIHATHHQDIRKMGGLRKLLPLSYICFMIGSLSLVGFPFFSGFYSKDFLLESSWGQYFDHSFPIYLIASISAFLTSFYSFRLIYFVFFGGVNLEKEKLKAVSESDFFLVLPLILLSMFSVFSGFLFKSLFLTSSTFWRNSLYFTPLTNHNLDFEFSNYIVKLLPTFFSITGILAVYLCYSIYPVVANYIYSYSTLFVNFFSRKFFIDSVYNYYVAASSVNFSLNFTYKVLDKGVFEHLGPYGLYKITDKFSRIVEKLSSPFIYHNLLFFSFFFIYVIIFVLLSNFYLILLFVMMPIFFQVNKI